jgi:hypothetical protein
MAGIKGMLPAKPKKNAMRRKVWQSMRIMRHFTGPDLCRASGAGLSNVCHFIRALARHGYIAKDRGYVSGRAGVYQPWRLVRDIGPDYPMRCDRCGLSLSQTCTKKEI